MFRRSFCCNHVNMDVQLERVIPPWAFLSRFSRNFELRNVRFSYRSVLKQTDDHSCAGKEDDAARFELGGNRWLSDCLLTVGVSWTISVKNYVDSGQWYLVPLLGIDHDFRINATQKEVCNKAEFPALVAEFYQDQFVTVLLYK